VPPRESLIFSDIYPFLSLKLQMILPRSGGITRLH
jgi:hypothetical protein